MIIAFYVAVNRSIAAGVVKQLKNKNAVKIRPQSNQVACDSLVFELRFLQKRTLFIRNLRNELQHFICVFGFTVSRISFVLVRQKRENLKQILTLNSPIVFFSELRCSVMTAKLIWTECTKWSQKITLYVSTYYINKTGHNIELKNQKLSLISFKLTCKEMN